MASRPFPRASNLPENSTAREPKPLREGGFGAGAYSAASCTGTGQGRNTAGNQALPLRRWAADSAIAGFLSLTALSALPSTHPRGPPPRYGLC